MNTLRNYCEVPSILTRIERNKVATGECTADWLQAMTVCVRSGARRIRAYSMSNSSGKLLLHKHGSHRWMSFGPFKTAEDAIAFAEAN